MEEEALYLLSLHFLFSLLLIYSSLSLRDGTVDFQYTVLEVKLVASR